MTDQTPTNPPTPPTPPQNPPPNQPDYSTNWQRWKCLVCGFLYEGPVIQLKCPKCQNEDPDKFEDLD